MFLEFKDFLKLKKDVFVGILKVGQRVRKSPAFDYYNIELCDLKFRK